MDTKIKLVKFLRRCNSDMPMKFFISAVSFVLIFFSQTLIQWQSPTEHDFGTIQQGKEVSERFTFINVSDAPLIIDNIRTDCSCTAPDWEKTPTLPHEKGVIVIQFHAEKTGYFQKKISVWIHNQRKPEYLMIEGEVE